MLDRGENGPGCRSGWFSSRDGALTRINPSMRDYYVAVSSSCQRSDGRLALAVGLPARDGRASAVT